MIETGQGGEPVMRIVLACDSFKESLSALEVGWAVEAGLRDVWPAVDVLHVPMADGGEGTAVTLAEATGGRLVACRVSGPLGAAVDARFAVIGEPPTAVIELAEAAGLALIAREKRDPLRATTYGVGEMICAALDVGCRHIILALGGSATNDGGAGLMQALGLRLLDDAGNELPPGAAFLASLAALDAKNLDPRLAEARIELACDVDNPLLGPEGATAVFGPQKGVTAETFPLIEAGLERLVGLLECLAARPLAVLPGIGAAGGAGLGLVAIADAAIRPGVEIVAEVQKLDAALCGADLVITGEGRIDAQTVRGKVPVGVARLARARGVPVIALAGAVGAGAQAVYPEGIGSVFSIINRPCSLDEALSDAAANLRFTAMNLARTLAMGRS